MLGLGDARGNHAGYRAGYAAVAGSEDCCGAPLCAPDPDFGGEVCCGGGGAHDQAAQCCADGGTTILSYVGPGGEYAQETSYRYVGAGAGHFGLLHFPGARPGCCCCLLVPLLLLPLAPLLLLLWPQTTTSTTSAPPITSMAPPELPTTSTPPMDCEEGEEAEWTAQKKGWCCDEEGRGCSEPPRPAPAPPAPAETTTPCPIDCNQGYDDLDPLQWVHGWSAAKKIYCCRVHSRGCPSELPPPSGLPPSGVPPEPERRIYDCDAGYHSCMRCVENSWSPKKISWCCEHRHKGCRGEMPA